MAWTIIGILMFVAYVAYIFFWWGPYDDEEEKE